MFKSIWRIAAAVIVLSLIGVGVYVFIRGSQVEIVDESFGAQVISALKVPRIVRDEPNGRARPNGDHFIEIRATSATADIPVIIDLYRYSAVIRFGDDDVQLNGGAVTLPGGLMAAMPENCKVVDVKQSQRGIRVWADGVEVYPTISEDAQRNKSRDLKTFDELRGDFENAEHFDLLSFDPSEKEMGHLRIDDRGTRKKLLDALRKGIADFDHSHDVLCFNPRHEIIATQGDDSINMLICFECAQVKSSKGKFQVNDIPQALFDKVLSDAGVPVPEPAKK